MCLLLNITKTGGLQHYHWLLTAKVLKNGRLNFAFWDGHDMMDISARNSDFDSSQRCHGPSFAGPSSLTSKTMMAVAVANVVVAEVAAAAFLLELST